MSEKTPIPDHSGRPAKIRAKDLLGDKAEHILLLIAAGYATWAEIWQYEPNNNTYSTLQDLIDKGYVGCDASGKRYWITEKTRKQLSY